MQASDYINAGTHQYDELVLDLHGESRPMHIKRL